MKSRTPSSCPYCHGKGKYHFKIRLRVYHRCLECDLIYIVDARDRGVKVIKYYEEKYYEKETADQKDEHRLGLNCHTLDLIESKKKTGKILDIGTGLGFFLEQAQKRGWQVYGIEPSKLSSAIAVELVGEKIFKGTLKEYKGNGGFDVLTFINVLDHSTEPWQEIDRATNLIKPHGLIYLRFPNGLIHTLVFRMASIFRAANLISRYVVFHEYCFTKKYIKRLLNDFGFKKIEVVNSIPSEGNPYRIFKNEFYDNNIKKFVYAITRLVYILSARNILLGISLEVTAFKR